MKRIPFLVIVFLIIVSIYLLLMQSEEQENTAPASIQTAFYATGANVVASEIYIRGKIDPKACDNRKERQEILTGIIRGICEEEKIGKPAFTEIDTDISRGTQTDYIINEDSKLHASILSENGGNMGKICWVSASLVNTSQKQSLAEAEADLEAAMKIWSRDTSVNVCITGSIDGSLDEEEVNAICDIILDSTGSNKVEGLKQDEFVSVSAFSPAIGNAVRVNGKRINLNMAVRYNSYEGKTYIWLASPVIATEY